MADQSTSENTNAPGAKTSSPTQSTRTWWPRRSNTPASLSSVSDKATTESPSAFDRDTAFLNLKTQRDKNRKHKDQAMGSKDGREMRNAHAALGLLYMDKMDSRYTDCNDGVTSTQASQQSLAKLLRTDSDVRSLNSGTACRTTVGLPRLLGWILLKTLADTLQLRDAPGSPPNPEARS